MSDPPASPRPAARDPAAANPDANPATANPDAGPAAANPQAGPVVVLAGGTGGAKLTRGMLDVVGPDNLTVIANTADDIEIYRAYVSPDPDLVTFWLADLIDDRGWGLRGDTFHVMDGLRELGVDVWFNLGDRDLAIGLERAAALARGERLTNAQSQIAAALGVTAKILPMSDNPVRTRVNAQRRWWPFQEFMIRGRGEGPVEDVDFHGIRAAPATPEALDAIATATAIVIGPSNPVISIGPILQTPRIREALATKPVIAVSPLVHGRVVKGPTDAFMQWLGRPLTSAGIAACYEGLIGGLVADDPDTGPAGSVAGSIPVRQTDVLMDTAEDRRRVAQTALEFALTLPPAHQSSGERCRSPSR